MTDPKNEIVERQEVPATVAAMLSAAELEQQIATARRFPRSIKRFLSEAHDLATWSAEAAEQSIYAVPRDGKIIRGPSARFAEILLARYGNCRVSSRIVNEDDQWITAQGIFHDLETNSATANEVRRRITDKRGRKFSIDMIGTTANAASSIAARNAILRGIPRAVWQTVFEACERTIAGSDKPLQDRRDAALLHFKRLGATPERVFAALDVAGLEEIGTDELITLQGIRQAIKDGELTIDEAFPPQRPSVAPGTSRVDEVKQTLAAIPKDDKAERIDRDTGEIIDEAQSELPMADERAAPPPK